MYRNEYNKLKYFLNTLLSAITTTVVFRNTLFVCIEGFTYEESKIVLWSCMGVLLLIGTIITQKYSRNDFSIYSTIGYALGIYSSITFLKYYKIICIMVGIVFCIVFSVRLYSLIIIKHKSESKHRISKRINFLLLIYRIVGIYFITVLILVTGSKLLDIGLAIPSVEKYMKTTGSSYSCDYEQLLQFKENWGCLSNSHRVDFLQHIANIEVDRLGLDHELNVILTVLDQNTYSSYCEATHTISVNIKFLETRTAEEMIDSIAHESAHAWQNQLITECKSGKETRVEYKEKAEIYKNEFLKYEKNIAIKDFDEYYNLDCEIDARTYASNELYYLCNLLSAELN